MVPGAGLEPAHHYWRGILNPLCLPISPPGQRFLLKTLLKIVINANYLLPIISLDNWRRNPESNRDPRICNPLHSHSAIPPQFALRSMALLKRPLWKSKTFQNQLQNNWSGKRDSNSRPRPWQGSALPTELFPL